MKRVITSLSLLLLLLCGATAQSISQYEYWTDDDYANRKVSSATGSDISLTVSTETLDAGVHFLNFRACRDDGVWGNFYRYLYYIPTLNSAVSGDIKVEYWLDDELAGMKSETANGGSLSLTIDISALPAGVHYFNCTPVATTGERGNSERYLFYVPQTFDKAETSPVKGFEYWLDDNYASKKVEQNGSLNPAITIGIGDLTSGVHYFNCRAFNERGEYGNPVREMFYIPETQTFSDAKLAFYEYWFDDDYAHCVKGNTANTSQVFTIDVSQLSSGVHYFNYWPIDDKGRRGNVTRQMFYLAKIVDPATCEEIDYEYWIDSDTEHKVTGKGTTGDYVFNIDVSALEKGTHTFNFRAKNILEQWGDTFIANFTISTEPQPTVTVTANDVTMVYGDDVPELTYTVTGGELTGQPKLTTTASKTSPVGIYSITIEKGTITNEHFTLVPGKLTITKAPLTIKAGSYTKREGDPMPEFTLSYEGWKLNETNSVLTKQPVVACEAAVNSEPGEYPVTVSGAEAQNYDISYVNGKLIVTTRPSYTLTYFVDGVLYKTYTIKEGATVTPEPAPTKEGYTFSGWSEIPATMPAHDVTVTGSFTVNKYKLTYMVDSEVYKSYEIEYGATITPEPAPTKEGYTFSGWNDLPSTMPAKDVTVSGSFTINQYTITYIIDGEVYQTVKIDYNSKITPPTPPEKEGFDFAWGEYPETMPAHDITITGTYTTGIMPIEMESGNAKIFTLEGKQVEQPKKGVNIVRMNNGSVKKVVVK